MYDPDEKDWFWDKEADKAIQIDGEDWYQCPRRPIKDDPGFFRRLIDLRNIREMGFVPHGGEYLRQPNVLVASLRELDGALVAVDQEKAKAAKLKNGR